MKKNPLQFAVVREDPQIELTLLKRFHFRRPLIIGSGGCTAFTLIQKDSTLKVSLIEPNPAQVSLIKRKKKLLEKYDRSEINKLFSINHHNPQSLIENGNFESLFRSFRRFIFEFIADEKEILHCFNNCNRWKKIFSHPYWPIAFDLFFSDDLLLTMFGPDAIQHGHSESYASYFRKLFERGLSRPPAKNNYFLHHVFLGRYLMHSRPDYLKKPLPVSRIEFFCGLAQDYPDFSKHDFIGLSNIFDWSEEKQVKRIAERVAKELHPGGLIVFRQLNNKKNFNSFFGKDIEWLSKEAKSMNRTDRSLFYCQLHIGRKKP